MNKNINYIFIFILLIIIFVCLYFIIYKKLSIAPYIKESLDMMDDDTDTKECKNLIKYGEFHNNDNPVYNK